MIWSRNPPAVYQSLFYMNFLQPLIMMVIPTSRKISSLLAPVELFSLGLLLTSLSNPVCVAGSPWSVTVPWGLDHSIVLSHGLSTTHLLKEFQFLTLLVSAHTSVVSVVFWIFFTWTPQRHQIHSKPDLLPKSLPSPTPSSSSHKSCLFYRLCIIYFSLQFHGFLVSSQLDHYKN